MKEVVFDNSDTRILEGRIPEDTPVFALNEGKVAGLIVEEGLNGWILRIGGDLGSNGHKPTRLGCIQAAEKFGYTFVTDIKLEDIV